MNRHHWNTTPRFYRHHGAAFRTPEWSCAIERPYPSLWRRILEAVKEMVR